MKDNTKAFERLMRRKLAAGLLHAAQVHAAHYNDRVTEVTGERPIPWGKSRPGHPWRSDPGEYPFVDPDNEAVGHGYEDIAAGIDHTGTVARSGVKQGGMHLYYLSNDPAWIAQYGSRLGMVEAYHEAREEVAEAFFNAVRSAK